MDEVRRKAKREKIAALVKGGATEGERSAARAALERFDTAHPPETTPKAPTAPHGPLGAIGGWVFVDRHSPTTLSALDPDGAPYLLRRHSSGGAMACEVCDDTITPSEARWSPWERPDDALCCTCVDGSLAPEPPRDPGEVARDLWREWMG